MEVQEAAVAILAAISGNGQDPAGDGLEDS
jgi:hypothetical protein